MAARRSASRIYRQAFRAYRGSPCSPQRRLPPPANGADRFFPACRSACRPDNRQPPAGTMRQYPRLYTARSGARAAPRSSARQTRNAARQRLSTAVVKAQLLRCPAWLRVRLPGHREIPSQESWRSCRMLHPLHRRWWSPAGCSRQRH